MKTKEIPTVFVLNVFAWGLCALGVLGGGYWIVAGSAGLRAVIAGCLIMFAGALAALLIRVFGNIAQMIFDQNRKLEELRQGLSRLDNLEKLGRLEKLDRLEGINHAVDQINCDSKDINQNLDQVRVFFEQI